MSRTVYDLIVFSHLRWDYVYQRPQHLISRAARDRRVLFVEEPIFEDRRGATLDLRTSREGVSVITPVLPRATSPAEATAVQQVLLQEHVRLSGLSRYVTWLYTPMAWPLCSGLTPLAVVYDCMDELSAFAGAPSDMRERERVLLQKADIVFTGGHSLYQAKRHLHPRVREFPSAVDVRHFRQARQPNDEPADQANIPHPRAGFFGVIDERLDIPLVSDLATGWPELQLVMIGPVAKIDPSVLPRHPNIHWLGQRAYEDLPAYAASWDVALLPFALNDATRFCSPTKTPEYLAAGLPVVSSPIRDVVHPYGEQGLVRIADSAETFADAIRSALKDDRVQRWKNADRLLDNLSWDRIWSSMDGMIDQSLQARSLERMAPAWERRRPARNVSQALSDTLRALG